MSLKNLLRCLSQIPNPTSPQNDVCFEIHQMGLASFIDAMGMQLDAIAEVLEVAFILSIIDLDIRRVQSFLPFAIIVFNFDKCSKSGSPAEPAC